MSAEPVVWYSFAVTALATFRRKVLPLSLTVGVPWLVGPVLLLMVALGQPVFAYRRPALPR
ncbi:hypothetical protein SAMN05421806_101478 [Streptomyces indicus]|uniref:Uncharacterized protein n=2 Tax=Streptomyces indicus TaxID=417292 RepID=A0A1G8TX47_9ACTN|nr:hypothetical protein SAMN05421806_101478 [Streptomyces indicus]